ncbi:cyclopropane-fatty-acyl-phospholipid synthase family protein [Nocardia vinacea]|uniref:cyclopropane-fatty-acyl-phospholipid synthase family protein n=1 Tax=Nocardia vinacea TaxID=96468 RepID=UPI002E157241|nr:cyclopropane-fatty-acyl-phospholipid synthase family protein [Nocardia vinacea]
MTETTEYRGASQDAIQHHYDFGNSFYELWLDAGLNYSCALWEDGDTLEQAQVRKIDYLLESGAARESQRILDIGCGWGSLMRAALDRYGVSHATGITLSSQQYDHIKGLSDDRIDVRLESWVDHQPDQPYDAIFCVGAMEHFVRFGSSRQEKVAAYRQFFEHCYKILKPGGRLVVQTIAKGNRPIDHAVIADNAFLWAEIFPESDMPRFAEVAHAAEKLFEVRSVVNGREDYAKTCREWLERLRANRDKATEVVGEASVHTYERYLDVSAGQFDNEHLVLLRFAFRRVPE